MASYKYKIVEFTPDQKMEKAFNDLGKDGWELVSVTPTGLMIKGNYDSTYGYGGGGTNGHFENDLCVFNKQF
jgi:hypothetical protein